MRIRKEDFDFHVLEMCISVLIATPIFLWEWSSSPEGKVSFFRIFHSLLFGVDLNASAQER
jgi:hypothetical protein